jgi:hypothetical protein
MNIRKSVRSVVCLISVVAVGLAAFGFTPAPARAEAGQAFSISPPLVELSADPGQTVTAKIKLTNISTEELLIKTQLNDFGAKDETGAPNIIFDDNQNSSYSLRQWITSPPPFKVKNKETKTVELPITVPADAEPGGHYAVIRFTGTTSELEDNGVALNASIGSLVLLQVSGDITQKASIAEFLTTAGGNKADFFESGPITFAERVKNEGNVHLKPTGNVEIYNMFGQKAASLATNGDPKNAANPPKSVLPGSVRRFEQQWDSGWAFGRYTANVELTYGGDQTISASTSFWIIPYKLITLVLIVGIGLFFAARFAIKRYNAHIIAKASGKKSFKRR